jgi:hypothetical protein
MNLVPGTRLLVISAIGFLAGCATSEVHYRDLFMPLNRLGVKASQLEELPVFLVQADTKEAADDARLILDTSPEPTVLETDPAGQVMIPVDSALLRNNPPVRIEPQGVNLVLAFSGKFEGRDARSVQVRSASGLKKTGDSRVAVFHEKGDEALARAVRAALIRTRGEIQSILHLEPRRWAVILETDREEKNVLYLTVPAAGYDSTWRCFREEWENGDFMDVNPHEWAETTLTSAIRLYDDPRNRFIGDGLAEFVTWKVSGLPRDYIERLSPAEIGDRETVDLLSAFQVVPGKFLLQGRLDRIPAKHAYIPGYALSFAFWHELYEEHGPTLIPAFVERLAQQPTAGADEAIAILVALTGDQAIGDRIRQANVEAARSRIRRLTP